MSTDRLLARLTELDAVPKVCLSGRGRRALGSETGSTSDSDAYDLHSRDVYVPLSVRRDAGVSFGIDSEAISECPTTHPPNGAVGFLFYGESQPSFSFEGHRWRSG
jgi:hypothetical protein